MRTAVLLAAAATMLAACGGGQPPSVSTPPLQASALPSFIPATTVAPTRTPKPTSPPTPPRTQAATRPSASAAPSTAPGPLTATVTKAEIGYLEVAVPNDVRIRCAAKASLPDGRALNPAYLESRTQTAGVVSWNYPVPSSAPGGGLYVVTCTRGNESVTAYANFPVP